MPSSTAMPHICGIASARGSRGAGPDDPAILRNQSRPPRAPIGFVSGSHGHAESGKIRMRILSTRSVWPSF